MRRIVWGAVGGAVLIVVIAHLVAWWNWESPFQFGRAASTWAMDWMSTLIPYGALTGGAIGFMLNRRARKSEGEAVDQN